MGYQLVKESKWKVNLWKVSVGVFLAFNIPFLLFAITMYSKKSRVEAMYHLYENKTVKARVLLEGSSTQRVSMMPKFYAKDWHMQFIERTDSTQDLKGNTDLNFDYIFFFDEKDLNKRISEYKTIYPKMALSKKCYPSTIDVMLRELNPRNANEYIEIWSTNIPKEN